MDFIMSMTLPILAAFLLFSIGLITGKVCVLNVVGQLPFWFVAVFLSWGWALSLLVNLPRWLERSWWFPLGCIAASALPAGILYAMRNRKKWLSLLPTAGIFAYIFLTVGCAGYLTRKPEAPTGPHFKILTYNLNWGAPRPDISLDAILNADADIVCLQETTRAWENYLVPQLKEKFPHYLFRHYGGAGGMAIFAKRPIKDSAYVTQKAGWFPGWVFEAETPLGTVQILAVHLHPAVSERGSFTPSAYYSTKSIRLTEVQDLYPYLNNGMPTIILGDFNEGDSGYAVKWLKEKGMTNALPEFDAYSKTWEWHTSVVTIRKRLDHIFYTSDLYCLNSYVLKESASDHFPVVAVFQKRDKNTPNRPEENSK
jgi:endonuclease/exonuclease/phosphatase (EEP) superfamily protein YafD